MYQMQKGARVDGGVSTINLLPEGQKRMDANAAAYEQWPGNYGVSSRQDFLNNPVAQERAMAGFIQAADRQLRYYGAYRQLGNEIKDDDQPVTITSGGLLAAAHRQGAKRVAEYLDFLAASGWRPDYSGLDSKRNERV